jgi:hypothetical protein
VHPRLSAAVLGLTVAALGACSTPSDPPAPDPAPATSAAGPAPATSAAEAPGAYQGRWWTWAATEPEATNPVADRTGQHCARNQPDDVWFLAGTFGGSVKRTCRVPAGRRIVAPLVNLVAGSSADCADFMADARGSAALDGTKLKPERRAGDDVLVDAAAGNALGFETGRVSGTACGLWVRFGPLPAGKHTLKIRGAAADFAVAVDYTLRVDAS